MTPMEKLRQLLTMRGIKWFRGGDDPEHWVDDPRQTLVLREGLDPIRFMDGDEEELLYIESWCTPQQAIQITLDSQRMWRLERLATDLAATLIMAEQQRGLSLLTKDLRDRLVDEGIIDG